MLMVSVDVASSVLQLPPGKYHCPVTFKIFNDNTHIVAIRVTGNVFSYEVQYTPTTLLTPSHPHTGSGAAQLTNQEHA